MLKKITSTFLSLVIVLYMVTLAFPTAQALDNEYDSAKNYALNTTENGTLKNAYDKHTFKFSLQSSGKIELKAFSQLDNTSYYIFDCFGKEIWRVTNFCPDDTSTSAILKAKINLTSGDYYFQITNGIIDNCDCGYSFSIDYTNSEESFKETENGTNNSFDTASNISVNQSYKGQIALNDGKDYYKFELKESSKVNLKISANIESSNYYLYDSNENEIWKKTAQYWDNDNNIMNINEDIYLNSGTYYFLVDKYFDYEGTYTFSTTATSAEETFSELENGSNNDFDEASNITLGNEIKGQISVNDGKDYYKFELKESSKVNLKISANIESSNYYLYDSNENEIWKKTAQYWDNDNNIMNINEDIYLNSGTYYFLVDKYFDYEGTYTFSTTATSAEETFSELENGSNNDFDEASNITLGNEIKGQISVNDGKDYYKFELKESSKVNLKISANIESSNYYLYDSNENEIWKKTAQYWDNNSKKLSIINTIQLKKGTYYFLVERYFGYSGSYNFSINQKVNNTEIKATSIKLNKKSYTLGVGQKFTLKATVSPTKANQKCKWTSSNSKIASVDKNGKVVAKKIGTINITATTTNGKKAICKITVKKAPTGIKLNRTKLTIKKGRKYTLKATLPKGSLNTLKWTTSNGRIATVNSKGLVTGKKKGKATITVKTYNGKSAKCKVTVK